MRFNWGKILLVLSLIFSIGVFYASNLNNKGRIINKINVKIIPNSSYFISADSIRNTINKYILTSKDSISLSHIEQEIDKNTSANGASIDRDRKRNVVSLVDMATIYPPVSIIL